MSDLFGSSYYEAQFPTDTLRHRTIKLNLTKVLKRSDELDIVNWPQRIPKYLCSEVCGGNRVLALPGFKHFQQDLKILREEKFYVKGHT